MKRPVTILTAVTLTILLGFCGSGLMASDKFSYDGQIRLRGELDLTSTDSSRHAQNFNLLRTRVGLKFEPTDRAFAYVQLQDSRTLGSPGSGDLSATDNVDLHQAYFVIDGAIFSPLLIKAGRFELNYGNQRVFGAVGWHNVGRSWEGGLLSYRGDKFTLDLFNLKKMELDDETYNRDFDIIGLYGKIDQAHLDLFLFYEVDADTNAADTSSQPFSQKKLKRFNLGGYYSNSFNSFDITAQTVFQFGEMPREPLPDSTVPTFQDISAFMIATELGYSFKCPCNARVALGIDYSSGDDGTDTTKYKAYTNAYYTGHKFRGFMDYFVPSDANGLMDIMLRGKFSVAPRWIFKSDFHYFKAAENYISKSDSTIVTSDIGMELDMSLTNKALSGATVTGGLSFFLPDDHFAAAGKYQETGVWAYFMTTLNF
ncbi:MAG: alginate export family protein [FCB group bacterium]|nr:alginate export family protein [FCB group bacterium]